MLWFKPTPLQCQFSIGLLVSDHICFILKVNSTSLLMKFSLWYVHMLKDCKKL